MIVLIYIIYFVNQVHDIEFAESLDIIINETLPALQKVHFFYIFWVQDAPFRFIFYTLKGTVYDSYFIPEDPASFVRRSESHPAKRTFSWMGDFGSPDKNRSWPDKNHWISLSMVIFIRCCVYLWVN